MRALREDFMRCRYFSEELRRRSGLVDAAVGATLLADRELVLANLAPGCEGGCKGPTCFITGCEPGGKRQLQSSVQISLQISKRRRRRISSDLVRDMQERTDLLIFLRTNGGAAKLPAKLTTYISTKPAGSTAFAWITCNFLYM